MIRFAWLQARTQTLVAVVSLAALGVVLAITGPHLVHLYDLNVAHCNEYDNCSTARSAFVQTDAILRSWLGILVSAVPGLIGIFWGAPLVTRELEHGTHRLAWTQSVTRSRWLAVKVALVCVVSMAVAGLLSLMVTWWASPLDRVNASLYSTFDQRDVVPLGYAAFAFTLGVLAGVLIRRTLPAMATTMVLFIAFRSAVTHWLRPQLVGSVHLARALDPNTMGFGSTGGPSSPMNLMPDPPNLPNAWIYSDRIVDKAGHALTAQHLTAVCPNLDSQPGPGPSRSSGGGLLGGHTSVRGAPPGGVRAALQDCVTKIGATYHETIRYQPPSHYWALQWSELGIYLCAAIALASLGTWWLRNRLS